MKAICLSCEYEPEWSAVAGKGEDARRYGSCRYPLAAPKMPAVYSIMSKSIIRYSDDSGMPGLCPTWEAKQKRGGNDGKL